MSSSNVADIGAIRPASGIGAASTYRADIDGLRAIAVISVVLFHMDAAWLPAGFVGVDIFFVISGFLITGLLVEEHGRNGRVDIAAFYARRVRRLLPALLLMVLATLIVGLLLLPASGPQQHLAKSAAAALFFVSNLFFARQPSGYFAVGADHYPLLHTWTLAVEEQFYIVWPLLVPLIAWAASRIGWWRSRVLLISYAAIALLSFALCQWMLQWRPNWAFYLTPFRAWEFAIGAMLALVLPAWVAAGGRYGQWLSSFGLAMILASFWVIDGTAAFPGPLAILPVTGSALMLAGGALSPASSIGRALSTGPVTYVGRISYGWYLWHWPFLAYLNYWADGEPHTVQIFAAAAASFAVAALSFRLVETPIRQRSWRPFATTRASLFSGAALLLLGGACAGATYVGAERTLAASPRLQAIFAAGDDILALDPACSNYVVPFERLATIDQCRMGSPTATRGIALWGDSHAHHLLPMLDLWARNNDRFVLPRTKGGCRPVDGRFQVVGLPPTPQNLRDCAGFHGDVVRELPSLGAAGIDHVIIASRWPFADDDPHRPVGARRDDWAQSLRQSVAAARAAGLRVLLVVDTPYFGRSVPDCLARHADTDCAAAATAVVAHRRDFLNVANPLAAADPGVGILDLTDLLCDAESCPAMRDGVVMMRDAGHLSAAASRALAVRGRERLDEALQ